MCFKNVFEPRLGLDLLIPEFIYVFIQIEDPSATESGPKTRYLDSDYVIKFLFYFIIIRVRDVVSSRKKIKVLNNNFVMSVGIRQVVTFHW